MELDLLSIACLSRASKGMMSSVATSSPIARMILKVQNLSVHTYTYLRTY